MMDDWLAVSTHSNNVYQSESVSHLLDGKSDTSAKLNPGQIGKYVARLP